MMKLKVSLAGIFGVLLVFGLVLAGCGDSGGGGGGDPALKGTVKITGSVKVNGTLTADTNNLQGTGVISYVWKRGDTETAVGAAIAGATSNTYTLVDPDDLAKYITVTVSRAGYSGSITSAASDKVKASTAVDLGGSVSISGTAKVGVALTAITTSLTGTSGTVSYEWKWSATEADADAGIGTLIPGETSSTYTPGAADQGKYIIVKVSYSGNSGSKSAVSDKVASADAVDLTGSVSIDGTVTIVGETLTANISGLDGTGTASYQWKWSTSTTGDKTPISGATSANYKLAASDKDRYITLYEI